MKKLTLSLDEETIEFAHKLAREKNNSISHMVGDFFRDLEKSRKEYVPDHPLVKELYGSFRGASVPKDKKAMREVLLQRYLK